MNNKTIKLYPIYGSLSGDLLFFAAINTLYLTTVKMISPFDISLMNTIAMAIVVIFRRPFLKLIFIIGNNNSIRLGSGLLLLSAILYTFGVYYSLYVGCVLYSVGLFFVEMKVSILKNNLEILGKEKEYLKIDSKSKCLYSFYTLIIAVIVPFMFNYNNYLPMIACIFVALTAFILSFFIKDTKTNNEQLQKLETKKFEFDKNFLIIILIMVLFVPLIVRGATYIKLLAQDVLMMELNIDIVVYFISGMVLMSRIIRFISSFIFNRICNRISNIHFVILGILLAISYFVIILGYYIPNTYVGYSFITIGFSLLFGLMDPIQLLIKNLILKKYSGNNVNKAISINYTALTFGQLFLSLFATLLLLGLDLICVIIFFEFFSVIELFLLIKLYVILADKNIQQRQNEQ